MLGNIHASAGGDVDERKSYTFVGWYNAKGKQVKAIPSGSTGNITLKAI